MSYPELLGPIMIRGVGLMIAHFSCSSHFPRILRTKGLIPPIFFLSQPLYIDIELIHVHPRLFIYTSQ